MVSVIIPTMKGREALLEKLLATIPSKHEIIVVHDEDILLAAKRNKGAKQAKGEYLLFIDDDNYLAPGAIEEALNLCERLDVGVVGFMAFYDDKPDTVADGGSRRNYLTGFTTGVNTNYKRCCVGNLPYKVDEIANCFMIHAELFFELQGLDENIFPIDLDEADLCLRVKNKGYKIMVHPKAMCYHKSITYSPLPDFRRPLNAYCMGRHRVRFQRNCNTFLRYCMYLIFFLPLFVGFYSATLLYRRKPVILLHFLKGVWDGVFCRKTHPYVERLRKSGGVPV